MEATHKAAIDDVHDQLVGIRLREKRAGFLASFTDQFSKAFTGGQLGQRTADAVVGGVVGAGLTAAAVGVDKVVKHIRHRVAKPQAYKAMISANPHLKRKAPAKVVQRAFDSLYHLNPHLAKDPLISGSFVDSTITGSKALESAAYISPQTAQSLSQKPGQQDLILKAFTGRVGSVDSTDPLQAELSRQRIRKKVKDRTEDPLQAELSKQRIRKKVKDMLTYPIIHGVK